MSLIQEVHNRVVRRLREDAEQDRLFRQQAIDVYENLVEYLKSGGRFEKEGPAKVVRLDWVMDLEKEAKQPLKIKWMSSDLRAGDDTGEYIQKNGPQIKLWVLNQAIFDSKNEARNAMRLGLQDNAKIFMHEYIHYLDDLRTDFGLKNIINYDPGENKSLSTYFTDPIEVNAYFQSGLAQVEAMIEDDDLFDMFMNREWSGGFRDFKEWFFSEQIPLPMETKIDDDQRKRLINRLYGFWERYIEPRLN